ncbi:MAG: bifunctional phosphoglucose/phosphomannose isomerase [Calditrichaeota bacterium]|nr:MAG: bifunctional phosphoglucose/phosphomannose isomerase [Calditrichota bacterium]
MFDFDRSNFIAFLNDFPSQLQKSRTSVEAFAPSFRAEGIGQLVFCGMGGSAIAGDLLAGLYSDRLSLPVTVVRDYVLPAYVGAQSLVFACSYSGNTEETLAATIAALERGATVVGVSSGGKLADLCREKGLPHLSLPEGFPPRQALGYLFFTLLFALEKIGLVEVDDRSLEETTSLLEQLREWFSPAGSVGHNLANHLAQSLYKGIPLIYTGAPYLHAVGVRWRNQLNENAKSMAFSNVFPEMNHNEIMGFEGVPETISPLRVILLRDREEHPRVQKRFQIVKKLLREKNVPTSEVFSEGESRLARVMSLVYIGDWVSYYVAMLYEKDPIDIKSIDYLKAELAGE